MCEKTVCCLAFDHCEISHEGKVYPCCPSWIKNNCIGNINHASFESIWKSPAAKAIRKSIIDGSYSYCDTKICPKPQRPICDEDKHCLILSPPRTYPKIVKLSYDCECNLSCFTCRNRPFAYSDSDLEDMDKDIDEKYLPILETVQQVILSGSGDPFASRHTRLLIRRIAETYPDIRFQFHTNGTLCNCRMLENLGVMDRTNLIDISLHSSTKEMWVKFTRGTEGQYDILLQNLNELADMKARGKLDLRFSFVLTYMNYRELAGFVRFADKFSALAFIWGYRNWGVQTEEEARELSIYEPYHRSYPELKEILKDPLFGLPHVFLFPEIERVRKEALENG